MSLKALITRRIGPALRHSRVTAVAQDGRQLRTITTEAEAAAAPIIEPPQLEDSPFPIPKQQGQSSRRDLLKDTKPFSDFLTDNFQRQHDYLRISLTERCNLRCVYCMPEEGVPLSPQRELLTTPEIVMLSSVFVSQGVNKIRLTGGEPTVRRDILPLMQQIGALGSHGLKELCLTTNGLALHRKLEGMVEAGLTGVNLSLDTLDPFQFQIMTRRKGFDAVMKSIQRILELNKHGAGIKLKINCVVMRGVNDREILPFVEMTREQDIEIRFIEYMPFDGNKWNKRKMVSYSEMLDLIREKYPGLDKVRDHKNDTSKTWKIPGFMGRIGFITSMTHNFCGTCNRLRITSDGNLKVCLFGNAEVSLRDILRQSNDGEPIEEEAYEAMKKIEMDRRQGLIDDSISLPPNEKELLNIVGMAVKRKKEKHAGIGELEHMKNRPMILIVEKTSALAGRCCGNMRTGIDLGYLGCELNGVVADAAHSSLNSCLQSLHCGSCRSTSTTSTIPRRLLPVHFPIPNNNSYGQHMRHFSSTHQSFKEDTNRTKLTHVSETGSAHMVSISDKIPTQRVATAVCRVLFTDATSIRLIKENQIKKGDVLGVARVAGIMAAKKTSDLIPLCHPIAISKVTVEFSVNGSPGENGWIDIEATVACEGKTGVEMEALTTASTAALTIYDMCKAVDKGMSIEGLRVVLKEGGKSGRWVDGVQDTSTNRCK